MKNVTLCLLTALLLTQFNFEAFAVPPDRLDKPDQEQEEVEKSYLLPTVVVRADKTGTDVQEMPSSATVFSAGAVEKRQIEKTRDIFNASPNMFFVKAGPDAHTGDSFAAIRGITSFMSGAPVIGFYVDDMYIPGYEIPLFDIDRIEVLRGPQGTLYGRNSQGGAISIFTKQPGNEFKGKITQSYGSYNTSTTTATTSGPLIKDRLGFNIAAQYENSDGYFENSYTGSNSVNAYHSWSGRGSLYFTPHDELKLSYTFDGQTYNGHYAEFNTLSKVYSDPHKVNVDWAGKAIKHSYGNSLRAEWTPADVKFLSITGFRHTYSRGDQDMDFTPLDLTRYYITTDNDLFTQEFRLQSDNDDAAFKWLAGLFFFHEKEDVHYKYGAGQDEQLVPGEHYTRDGTTKTDGFAVFGQGTYSLGAVDITLGLRYDYETKDFDYDYYATDGMKLNWGMTDFSGFSDNSYGVWLPKVALGWHATDNVMPYVSVSRGYRSGGFNLTQSPGKKYGPEYTWNYEMGLKTDWLDKKLTVNLAAFYIQWKDIQVMQPNFPEFEITNAGKAISKGLELDATWHPLPSLDLFVNAAYTDATFKDYSDSEGDYAGNRVPNVPKYTASAGLTYRFWDNFMVSADYTRIGPLEWDQANSESQSAYHLVNAKIGYEAENVEVYLWAKNLFDEKYATRAFNMNGEWYGRAGDPMVIGARAILKF